MNKTKRASEGWNPTANTNCTAISVCRIPFDTNRKGNVFSAPFHRSQRRPTSAGSLSVRDVHIDVHMHWAWQEDTKAFHYNLNSKTLLHISSLCVRILILTSFLTVECNLLKTTGYVKHCQLNIKQLHPLTTLHLRPFVRWWVKWKP